MPSSITAIARKAQDVRAQSLSTLMATLESVQPAARVGAGLADSPQASLQSAEAAVRAVFIEAQANGKALLQVAGALIEAELPPELLRAAAGNPGLLKPGSTLSLPASLLARPAQQPATLVALSGAASGTSVSAPPPLANPFPAGTLGALIARLTGIAFPQAEPATQVALSEAAAPGQNAASLRPATLAQPVPTELAHALLHAASRQLPLAGALNGLLAVPEAEMAQLPMPIQAAVRALQTARSTPEMLRTADGLRDAVMKSGLFLEGNLARQSTGGATATPDLKTLLLALRSALAGTGPEMQSGQHASKEATLNARQSVEGRLPPTREAGEAGRLPDIARVVEGALERVKLMQLASLPDHPEMRVTDDRAQGMRLALPIPLATSGLERPQTAVLGLVIEHQPPNAEPAAYQADPEGGSEGEAFPWKVRVALDLEETGPIQAEIALRGQSVAVTMWAERQVIATRVRDEIGALHDALTDAAFEVLKLEVRDGRPQGQTPRFAPVLDRRT